MIHWNENVVILTKFESLAALEVVILTTSSAASDENFIKMKTFPFQCCSNIIFCFNWEAETPICHNQWICVNSLRSSDAYMRR